MCEYCQFAFEELLMVNGLHSSFEVKAQGSIADRAIATLHVENAGPRNNLDLFFRSIMKEQSPETALFDNFQGSTWVVKFK